MDIISKYTDQQTPSSNMISSKESRFVFLLAVSLMNSFIAVNSRSLTPTHRTKRELYPGFKEKHIIFVKEGRKITYHLLKGRLPSFANTKSRTKHSYIVVFIKKKESETKKKKLFFEKLDTLVLNKIRDGKCKENLKHGKQDELIVRPNTCKNTKSKVDKNNKTIHFIELSNYFLCPVTVKEMMSKDTYLAEFNVQDQNQPCRFSNSGDFLLGAGKRKDVSKASLKKNPTGGFVVNHLDNSKLDGEIKDCIKKKHP